MTLHYQPYWHWRNTYNHTMLRVVPDQILLVYRGLVNTNTKLYYISYRLEMDVIKLSHFYCLDDTVFTLSALLAWAEHEQLQYLRVVPEVLPVPGVEQYRCVVARIPAAGLFDRVGPCRPWPPRVPVCPRRSSMRAGDRAACIAVSACCSCRLLHQQTR